MYKTSCEKCSFAKFVNDEFNILQTGCKLGRLDVFNKQGKASLTENGFYAIDTICNTCRDKDSGWGEGHSDLLQLVLKEIQIKTACVVVCRDKNLEDIKTTINSIKEQTIPFVKIFFVLPPGRNQEVILEIFRQFKDNNNIKTVVSTDKYNYGQYVDNAINQLTPKESMFYLATLAGNEIPREVNSKVNDKINTLLEQTFYLQGNNFEYVLTRIHKMTNGNAEATHELEDGTLIECNTLKQKITMLCGDGNRKDMMWQI